MARRKTRNRTGLPRIPGVAFNDAWISFVCLSCSSHNLLQVGGELLNPNETYETAEWACHECGFVHSKDTSLPFKAWPQQLRDKKRIPSQRFWQAFFRTATEHSDSYWKQCNTCGRVLPFAAFSRHQGWGPLARQMECRSCKAVINARLNPARTKQQLHEASARRRVADMLLEGEYRPVDVEALFTRFESKCFKTGRQLDINDGRSWAIDHILPSRYLYPLMTKNAALLSREANDQKRDRWPSDFYTNSELARLAALTGADLTLLTSKTPIINPNIDVDACVTRALTSARKV